MGYNGDYSTTLAQGDEFSFIALANLPAGTQITFSNSGYTDAAASPPNSLQYVAAYETWTAPAGGTAPGTVVRIQGVSSGVYNVSSGSVSLPSGGSGTGANMTITTVGDQLVAYQGPTAVGAGGTSGPINFIAALQIYYNFSNLDPITGWNANVPTFSAAQFSVKYPGLTNGQYCVVLGDATTTSPENGKYTGPLTGTACALRAAIHNKANWSLSETVVSAIGTKTLAPGVYVVRTGARSARLVVE